MPRRGGGTSETKMWNCEAWVLGPKESITAVIFDGWDHTSQNEQAACTHDYDLSQITKRLDGNDVAFMTHPWA